MLHDNVKTWLKLSPVRIVDQLHNPACRWSSSGHSVYIVVIVVIVVSLGGFKHALLKDFNVKKKQDGRQEGGN